MASYDIRVIGDPVLRQKARQVNDIDGALVRLVDDMIETMYEAPGIGLAAPQVGVQKRLFVWDMGEGPRVIVNPEIVESDGEWLYDEGCLSVPGLSWEIVRPKTVHLVGRDLDGNEMSLEVDELEARLFQHEIDHLDGTLLIERLDSDTRKTALKAIRDLQMAEAMPTSASTGSASTGSASTGSASTGSASTGSASTGSASTGSASTGSASTGSASTGSASNRAGEGLRLP